MWLDDRLKPMNVNVGSIVMNRDNLLSLKILMIWIGLLSNRLGLRLVFLIKNWQIVSRKKMVVSKWRVVKI